MTDQPLESAQDAPEVQPEPKAVPSVPSVGPAASPGTLADEDALVATLTKRLLAELKPAIEDTASRKAQSVTDGTLARKLKDYEKMAVKLKETGGDPQKAAREAAIDDLIGGGSPQGLVGAEPEEDEATAVMQAKTSIILESAGVDIEDPDYKKLVDRYQGRIQNPDAWEDVVQTFVDNRKKQESPPNPAAAVTGPGRPASRGTEEQEMQTITARLEVLQKAPSDNVAERAKLRARMKELRPQTKSGLNVT